MFEGSSKLSLILQNKYCIVISTPWAKYIYSEEKWLSSTARGNVGCTNLGTQGGNQHDKVGIGQCFEIFSLSYQEKFT